MAESSSPCGAKCQVPRLFSSSSHLPKSLRIISAPRIRLQICQAPLSAVPLKRNSTIANISWSGTRPCSMVEDCQSPFPIHASEERLMVNTYLIKLTDSSSTFEPRNLTSNALTRKDTQEAAELMGPARYNLLLACHNQDIRSASPRYSSVPLLRSPDWWIDGIGMI